MNRLQKKCVIVSAGFHLLLMLILFVGPAFFTSKPDLLDAKLLDMIPANVVDGVLSREGASAAKSQPAARPPAPPALPEPRPVIKHPEPNPPKALAEDKKQ